MVLRPRLLLVVVCAVLATTAGVVIASGSGASASRCEGFRKDSSDPARTQMSNSAGPRILVIGDSYSVGLGVDSGQGWPHRLPGHVLVDGFSGSGFSRHASDCGDLSYASRAAAALERAGEVGLVVVEGGLNDYDQPTAAIRRGFRSLLDRLAGLPVLVVGPTSAPSRAASVPRVDDLLARLCARNDVEYVRMTGIDFAYLSDGLHLTPAGHREFGDLVARRVARAH